jgi:uncharacterized protein with von Willebrand factor type A (vWA) domain
MFTGFFYLLRHEGVPVSLTEWMMLMEALVKGLAYSSLTSFYYLARGILVKSETDFDRYDLAFQKYFQGIETSDTLYEQVMDWLKNPLPALKLTPGEKERLQRLFQDKDFEKLMKALQERLQEQDGQHHGGSKWIGTGGRSPFGHSGFHPFGVRIGGGSVNRSAVKVAGERHYRDYRDDEILGVRQFEMALRKLRRFTTRVEGPEDELDLEATVDATCNNAGHLQLVWSRGRKNAVKVLLLMDVGGSMDPYSEICSQLFTAVNKSSHFKDLKFYYFHNCLYDYFFHDASLIRSRASRTEDILRTFSPDYKLIIVGDAAMAPSELLMEGGTIEWGYYNSEPGIFSLQQVARHFSHRVWLNPIPADDWERVWGNYTIDIVKKIFPMYALTLEGLDQAIKKLMVRK